MKAIVAGVAVVIVAALTLFALYQAVRFYAGIGRRGETEAAHDIDETLLGDEHRRHLAGLREVQFDYDTGKIDDDDYRALRRRHEMGAVKAMRQMKQRTAAPADAESEG